MKYKGVTIPKNNGRPQLWLRGCTSRKSYLAAVKATINYDSYTAPIFVGYI